MAAVYLKRLGVFMSVVYSVEEPAGLALPLRFTLGHFGLRGFVEREKKTRLGCCQCRAELTSGPDEATATSTNTGSAFQVPNFSKMNV